MPMMGPAAALPRAPAMDITASEKPCAGTRWTGVRDDTSNVEPATVVADHPSPSTISLAGTAPCLGCHGQENG